MNGNDTVNTCQVLKYRVLNELINDQIHTPHRRFYSRQVMSGISLLEPYGQKFTKNESSESGDGQWGKRMLGIPIDHLSSSDRDRAILN